jgi:DNA-binding NtrC family response regulator
VAQGATIEAVDLPGYLFHSTPAIDRTSDVEGGVPSDLDGSLAQMEKQFMLAALQQSGGVQAAAAQLLGISERSFWYRLKKLGIQVDRIAR